MPIVLALLAVLLAAANVVPAGAQTPSFQNKQMRLIVGHAVGADYDVGARLLARHLSKHIPGRPGIIVQNMLGAGGIVAANYLYKQAPRDGTVFGSFSRNFASQAMMGHPRIEADPRRFHYLGATSSPSRVCVASGTAKVKNFADVFTTELIVGAPAGSSLSMVPTVLNHVLNTKFKIIEGYKGTTDVIIAIERGEVEGLCSAFAQFRTHEQAIRDGKLRLLMRAEENPIPQLAHVPSVYDFAKTDEQRRFLRFVLSTTEFGRPYVLPPGTPEDVVAVMRKAVAAAATDPELIAEAERMKLDMIFTPPERLEQLVRSLYETPPAMVEAVRKLLPNL